MNCEEFLLRIVATVSPTRPVVILVELKLRVFPSQDNSWSWG